MFVFLRGARTHACRVRTHANTFLTNSGVYTSACARAARTSGSRCFTQRRYSGRAALWTVQAEGARVAELLPNVLFSACHCILQRFILFDERDPGY